MQIVADKSHRGTAQKAAGYAFLIRILSAGITYLSQILMARWMGVQEYGIYINVWVYVLLLGYVCNLGFAPASQRIVPEYRETGQDALLRGYLFGARLFSIGLATVIGAAGLLGLYFFGHLMTSHLVIPLYLGVFCLPLFGITDIQDGVSRSYNWTDIALIPTYLIRPLMILLVLAGGHAYGLPANAVTAMGGAIFACWFTGIVQYLALRHRLKGQIKPGPRQFAFKTWFRWSLPLFLAEGSYLMVGYTDVLVLEHFVSPAELAVYWAAAKTLALVSFIYFSVSAATAHRFSEYHVLGDHAKLAQLLSDAMRWTFYPSLAAVLGMLIMGKPLLWLFGPQFMDGYVYIAVLSVGLLARSAAGPSERFLSMLGHQYLCISIYMMTFAVNLILCIVLIPRLGPLGAAIAGSMALCLESILLFSTIRWRLGYRVSIWGKAA